MWFCWRFCSLCVCVFSVCMCAGNVAFQNDVKVIILREARSLLLADVRYKCVFAINTIKHTMGMHFILENFSLSFSILFSLVIARSLGIIVIHSFWLGQAFMVFDIPFCLSSLIADDQQNQQFFLMIARSIHANQ